MAVDRAAFARAARKRQKVARTLRPYEERTGEWVVLTEQGAKAAFGFDTRTEAEDWIREQQG